MKRTDTPPPITEIMEIDGKTYTATQVATGRENPVKNSFVNADVESVTVNVFFDGTLNNIYNANPNAAGTIESSYEGDFSNIGRMFLSVKDKDTQKSKYIYIEGIGSARGKADDQDGFALGTGETGIKKRVQQAIDTVKEYLNTKQPAGMRVTLNVFGFSRGAAAARHFIHRIVDTPFVFQGKTGQYPFGVAFVGLFDTVSSFAHDKTEASEQVVSKGSKEAPFSDDVGQLGLKFTTERHAARVVHITAGDEFRINFRLTNIQSAINLNKGYEVQIPGAHSDVGGGYLRNVKEYRDIYSDNTVFELDKHLHWWGWYRPFETSRQVLPYPANRAHCKMWRGELYQDYYKVALRAMLEMVKRYTDIQFPAVDVIKTTFDRKTDPWNSLRYLSDEVLTHVLKYAPKRGEARGVRAPNFVMKYNSPSDVAYSQRVYRHFLHFSSNDALAQGLTSELLKIRPHQPRIGSDGRPTRGETIAG